MYRLKVTLIILGIVCLGFWIAFGGMKYGQAEAANEIVVRNVFLPPAVVTPKETMAAVMQRIADCESGGGVKGGAHQFNKDGTIVMHQNNNGSIDEGYMQINLTVAHINQAAKMGLNLSNEEDNKAFGVWIYENEGTDPWSASAKCWRR